MNHFDDNDLFDDKLRYNKHEIEQLYDIMILSVILIY